jgi:hypothetical protein
LSPFSTKSISSRSFQPTSETIGLPPAESTKRNGLRKPRAKIFVQVSLRSSLRGQKAWSGSPRPERSTWRILPAVLSSS